jgi:hypothetical protein
LLRSAVANNGTYLGCVWRTDERGTRIPENTETVLTKNLNEKLIENGDFKGTGVTSDRSDNLRFARAYRVGNPAK